MTTLILETVTEDQRVIFGIGNKAGQAIHVAADSDPAAAIRGAFPALEKPFRRQVPVAPALELAALHTSEVCRTRRW